jgi:hypothetical protein
MTQFISSDVSLNRPSSRILENSVCPRTGGAGDSHLKKRRSSCNRPTNSFSADHMALYEEAMKRFLDELAALIPAPKKRLALRRRSIEE